jgi:hypothetical protein
MMKWMTITALSSIGGYAGWNFGQRFFDGQSGLWFSLFGGLAGTAAAYFLIPRD